MKRAYLAAPYAARETVREYADELIRIGYEVTSSWLSEKHEINPGTTGAATDLTHARPDKCGECGRFIGATHRCKT